MTDYKTADGVPLTDKMRVWDYNLETGTVDLSTIDSGGWFDVHLDGGGTSYMNAERVCVAHPFTHKTPLPNVRRVSVTVHVDVNVDDYRTEYGAREVRNLEDYTRDQVIGAAVQQFERLGWGIVDEEDTDA
jgi:hypothetical protein